MKAWPREMNGRRDGCFTPAGEIAVAFFCAALTNGLSRILRRVALETGLSKPVAQLQAALSPTLIKLDELHLPLPYYY